MNKSTIFYAVAFLLVAVTAKAQITIDQTDLQGILGNTYDVSAYETTTASDLTSIAALKGANQTFDFTTISSFSENYSGTISYMNLPADIPGANNPDFANANAAFKISFTGMKSNK